MARMIPPQVSPRSPSGEVQLFRKLRDDPGTTEWTVLHSLELKRHPNKLEGELDMVILVPGFGVLCVEVKSCDVARKGGQWIYPYGTSSEGPFRQVSSAMHALREYLVRKDPTLARILLFSAVIFTQVEFCEESPEWHAWQYIARRNFLRRPISESVREILSRAHKRVGSTATCRSWYDETKSRPTSIQIRKVSELLRDDFEYATSPREELEQSEEVIQHFTEEQFAALDQMEDNRRILFSGPAGTGKTFLAIEAAKRAVDDGKSVLFLCFNALLGEWLKVRTQEFLGPRAGSSFCGTFHRLMLEIAETTPDATANSAFWEKALPSRAIDALLSDKRRWGTYDLLIADEAQDLFVDEYLDVLDLLVAGGLAAGHWMCFGDFERQAIYQHAKAGAAGGIELLKARAPIHTQYSLRINCRNAEPIAETVTIATGLHPGYSKILHGIDGADVDPLFYSNTTNQTQLLKTSIGVLRKKFRPDDIIILSMRGDSASCAGILDRTGAPFRMAPVRGRTDAETIGYCSIHAFKGMEAPAVILTDIEGIDDDHSRALLYVGMSRARVRLVMLMREECRSSYDRLLEAGLKKTIRD